MTSPSTTIILKPDQVIVESINSKGMKSVTNTNIESIQRIFMKEQAMETPLLPSQWGVVKYYRKNQYEGYVLTTPSTERIVTFTGVQRGGSLKKLVPIPPLLWIFEVQSTPEDRKILTHSMVYVLKHELLGLKDELFHAPFPNIGTNHGICWGMGNIPNVPSSKSIQNIPAQFFTQPFNLDLSGNRVKEFKRTKEDGSTEKTDNAVYHMIHVADQLKEAKENQLVYVYPFDMLKEAGMINAETAIRNTLPGIFNS